MAKFYYQFPLESKEGRLLAKFHNACIDAQRKADRYARHMGAASYFEDPNFFAGGVSALAFAEPKKVNTDVWRFVQKTDDGVQWFEPNVRTSVGCVKARDGFTPSDVAGRIYKKEPVGWDEVRQMYSLTEWLAFCGFNSSGDKEIDTKAVVGMLKNKQFYTYIEIIPMSEPVMGRKRSRDGSKAVRAEQSRMRLPTVRTEDFYGIVHADMKDEEKGSSDGTAKKEETMTPVFFAYLESWWIGLDYPICHEGFDAILPIRFTAIKNQMLRELRNKT